MMMIDAMSCRVQKTSRQFDFVFSRHWSNLLSLCWCTCSFQINQLRHQLALKDSCLQFYTRADSNNSFDERSDNPTSITWVWMSRGFRRSACYYALLLLLRSISSLLKIHHHLHTCDKHSLFLCSSPASPLSQRNFSWISVIIWWVWFDTYFHFVFCMCVYDEWLQQPGHVSSMTDRLRGARPLSSAWLVPHSDRRWSSLSVWCRLSGSRDIFNQTQAVCRETRDSWQYVPCVRYDPSEDISACNWPLAPRSRWHIKTLR